MKTNFIDLLKKYGFEEQKKLKKIYNQINDLNIYEFKNIFLSEDELEKILKIFNKVLNGEDITFDIGYKYFYENKLKIKRGVFVPQFDTEQIIDLVKKLNLNKGKILEIGSGTGAISIALAKETNFLITSIDINPLAIQLSRENDKLKKVHFKEADFFKFHINEFEEKFDLIISNPPYIDYDDQDVEDWVINNQPKDSIFAKNNGYIFYEEIFKKCKFLLKNNGYIILEFGYNQAKKVKEIFQSIAKKIEIIKDLNGYNRFIIIEYNGKENIKTS